MGSKRGSPRTHPLGAHKVVGLPAEGPVRSSVSPVEVWLKKKESFGIFEVIDHGTGIPAEDLPHIFEGYVVGDKKDTDSLRGMGIGLSICMSIIKVHGGKIEAENQTNGGAVFRFALPLEGNESA